jgi:hypothetical protein
VDDNTRPTQNNRGVPKWVKLLIGVLLVPLCLGASGTLLRVLQSGHDVAIAWPLLAGAGCWVVIFLLLPKPVWIYVFGHELTHALWTWLFLGRVKRFKVGARGGHVVVSKVNFLIMLAPYFFPLYAIGVAGIYAVSTRFGDLRPYHALFLLALGAAYAFHVSLTAHALQTPQTDLSSQGYLFSAAIIWLGNVVVLLIALPVLLGLPLTTVGAWVKEDTLRLLHTTWAWFRN